MIRGRRGGPEKLHNEGEVVMSPPDILRPPPAPGFPCQQYLFFNPQLQDFYNFAIIFVSYLALLFSSSASIISIRATSLAWSRWVIRGLWKGGRGGGGGGGGGGGCGGGVEMCHLYISGEADELLQLLVIPGQGSAPPGPPGCPGRGPSPGPGPTPGLGLGPGPGEWP